MCLSIYFDSHLLQLCCMWEIGKYVMYGTLVMAILVKQASSNAAFASISNFPEYNVLYKTCPCLNRIVNDTDS